MKEIIHIHLAKTPYDIEVDAKQSLDKYLSLIHKNMHAEPEAMREIEARFVEILAESGVNPDGIITANDVDQLRQRMGEPQDFSSLDNTKPSSSSDITDEDTPIKSPKRLMRDYDHALLSGVCAGLAAYFNLDPVIFRLIFIIMSFLTFGFTVPIYLVFWLCMPIARTATEKLQMRGQAVTFDSLNQLSKQEEQSISNPPILRKFVSFCLSLGFTLSAIGGIFALIFGTFFGYHVASLFSGLSTQFWAFAILVTLIIGTILFILLSTTLAQASFRWCFSRLTTRLTLASILLGLFCCILLPILAIQGKIQYEHDLNSHTKTTTIQLPADLSTVKYYRIEDDYATNLSQELISTNSPIRLELEYTDFKSNNIPQFQTSIDGDTLVIHSTSETCQSDSVDWLLGLDPCNVNRNNLKIYGPLLHESNKTNPLSE